MTLKSPRIGLGFLAPQQAQKHVIVNETFQRLDAVVQLSVLSTEVSTAPANPNEGDTYILPESTSGEQWGNLDGGMIASFQDNHWQVTAPREGWRAWAINLAQLIVFKNGSWQTVTSPTSAGSQEAETPSQFGINTLADQTNRLSVKSDAVLLSHDDQTPGTGDMRLFANKSQSNQTAALIFESAFSPRAEFGLLKDDNLSLKVSPNGSDWSTVYDVRANLGEVTFNNHMSIFRRRPSDFWSNGGSSSGLFLPYGYLGTNGSFGIGLWHNGYRNTSGGWTSQNLLGSQHGAGFEVQTNGCFIRYQSNLATAFPAIRLRVDDSRVSPGSDNLLTCGDPSHRWSQIYAVSGAISTSDARYKTIDGAINDAEAETAKVILQNIIKYRWNDATKAKGRDARQHFGVTAQSVVAAFKANGLDAGRYGIWCEDKIVEHYEDENGQQSTIETGETRQGIRYDELLIFLLAAMTRNSDAMDS